MMLFANQPEGAKKAEGPEAKPENHNSVTMESFALPPHIADAFYNSPDKRGKNAPGAPYAPYGKDGEGSYSDIIEEVRMYVPGKKTKYKPKQGKMKAEWQMEWENAVGELNVSQNLLDHFLGLQRAIEDPSFDPENPRWQGKFRDTFKTFSNLQEITPIWENISAETKKAITQGAENESKTKVIEYIKDIESALIQARAEALLLIEKQMRLDFEARIEYLEDQWKKHTPKDYESVKDNWLKLLKYIKERIGKIPELMDPASTDKNRLADMTDPAKRLAYYRQTWDDMDRLEDSFKVAKEGSNYQYNEERLTQKLEELDRAKKEKIDPIAEAYRKESESIIGEIGKNITKLEACRVTIRADKNMPDEEKERELRKIDGEIESLKKAQKSLNDSKDISKVFNDILYSEEPQMVDEEEEVDDPNNPGKKIKRKTGRKVPYEIQLGGEGPKIPLKKGLKAQIALLNQLPFNAEERKRMALGIEQALDKACEEINGTENFLQEKLVVVREKLNMQSRGLSPEQAEGKSWKYSVLAVADFKQFGATISEWATRRYERVQKGRINEFGESAMSFLDNDFIGKLGPLSSLRQIPAEFDKQVEQAEASEVSHFKEMYGAFEIWHVEHIAYHTSNPDELRACLNLLADDGRLRWDNPKLWAQFNKFQKIIKIPLSKKYNMQNAGTFNSQLRRSIEAIWDDMDLFNTLKNTNSSSYESKRGGFSKQCDELVEAEGGLQSHLDKMLSEFKAGKDSEDGAKVDPIFYEGIIDYCIQQGKIGAEEKMYYLIQGIASGLLAPDRGSVLCSQRINSYPILDYFGSATSRAARPTLDDLEVIASYDKDTFNEWFHTKGMLYAKVTQRVDKTLTQGNKLDHDDLRAFLGYMSGGTTEAMLKKYGDGYRLPLTGIQNATTAMLFFMDNIAENFGNLDPEGTDRSAEQLQRFVDSFVRFDSILGNRMYEGDKDIFRWDSTSLDASPRAAGDLAGMYGRGKEMTCRKNMNQVQEYIKMLDPEFFGAIFGGKIKGDERKWATYLKTEYPDEMTEYLQTAKLDSLDDIYRATGAVIKSILKTKNTRIAAMFARIRADHEKVWLETEARGGESFRQKRETARQKREDIIANQGREARAHQTDEYDPNKHNRKRHGGKRKQSVESQNPHAKTEGQNQEGGSRGEARSTDPVADVLSGVNAQVNEVTGSDGKTKT
ncbi:MAG: hypothetical protein WC897_01340 [Candidatus Gracilibacteria bacterium]